jgi:predicted NACHT family NTPase
MSQDVDTAATTMALSISNKPRKFSPRDAASSLISEDEILRFANSKILLGDPGSGKTTTLKRIVFRMLTEPGVVPGEEPEFPILVTAKDLRGERTIYDQILSIFGIEYAFKSDKNTTKEKLEEKRKHGRNIVNSILEERRIAVIFDGIDEVDIYYRERLFDDLQDIRNCSSSSKILASCRSGEFLYLLEGFSIIEILPLSELEVNEIAGYGAQILKDLAPPSRKFIIKSYCRGPCFFVI